MRILAQLIALLFAGQIAAQIAFNLVQDNVNTLSAQGRSINELEDGFLFFSAEWSSDSSNTALYVSRLDEWGSLLWRNEYHLAPRDVDAGVIDPIARPNDSLFVASLTQFGGLEPNVTWLYWFDQDGDTIRTRFLKSDSNAVTGNHGTRQLLALSDGGFLHCGWCANTPPGQGGCITRLDSAGTILWERIYPQAEYIQNAREAPDGGFVLGGSRNAQQDEAVVIRTDSAGNVDWVRYHGLHAIVGGQRALFTSDGSVLMPGNWKSDPSPLTYEQWACLYSYSDNGILQSRSDYHYGYLAAAVHLLPKGNDHYWLVGGTNQYELNPDGVALLWELDENLDSLWMRKYWYYAANGSYSATYSVRVTSDGGLVMCGVSRQGQTDPLPYKQDNWLIKLDSHGCLVPGCHNVGIEEVVLGLNERLRIAPNPVRDVLSAELELPTGVRAQGSARAVLLNGEGQQVRSGRMLANGALLSLREDVSALPRGMYYLHIADEERWLAGAKLVVE